MLDKFWESLGEDLAGEWLKHLFGPAFLFWVGGMGAYLLHHPWMDVWNRLNNLEPLQQAVLLLLALLGLIGSSHLVQRLRFSFLRMLEGYWPWPFSWVAEGLTRFRAWHFSRIETRLNTWKTLESKGALTLSCKRRMAELEMRLHYAPADPQEMQPTILGNILRSAETAPAHKYGLDAFACWPRLWLLLPESARKDLATARQSLMQFTELWTWGMLFLIWTFWSPWAFVVSITWMGLAYSFSQQAAMTYADLIEATFDLYRWGLYETIHWSPPEQSGANEVACGQQLTEFLWRGTSSTPIPYVQRKKE